jgi:predicted Zn-dependent protease
MQTITSAQLRDLIEQQRPLSLLQALDSEHSPSEFLPFKAEALLDLALPQEAQACLDSISEPLEGDMKLYMQVLRAYLLIGAGKIDQGMLLVKRSLSDDAGPYYRAFAHGCLARCYASKSCPDLAQAQLNYAEQAAPQSFPSLSARARVALMLDQRLEARAIYESMLEGFPAFAHYQLAVVAYLLAEFDEAEAQLEAALASSEEFIDPWQLRAANALRANNPDLLESYGKEIEKRSPRCEMLEALRDDVEAMRQRQTQSSSNRVVLSEFPSTIQRRNYCGPCTIELILRYWKGGLDLTNDQIAAVVKQPGSGTPIYRLREFFHLVGFDTLRCRLSANQIKRLIDAKYPVIIEQAFPNSFHVTVVIGYDDDEEVMILQDPSSHTITELSLESFDALRISSLNGSIVAFPAKQGHERTLALLDIYDEQALLWYDQACIAIDDGQHQEGVELLQQAIGRYPNFELAWLTYIHASFLRWDRIYSSGRWPKDSLAAKLSPQRDQLESATIEYRALLLEAQERLPNAAKVRARIGHFAQLIGDLDWALSELQHAAQQEPNNALVLAMLAGVHFDRCEFQAGLEVAEQATQSDPSDTYADLWMARLLAALENGACLHYAECAIERRPTWWMTQLALGEAYLANHVLAKAQPALAYAESIYPSGWPTRLTHADIQIYCGEPSSASHVFEQALEHLGELTPYQRYLTHYDLACLHVHLGELEKACELIQLALQDNPEYLPMLKSLFDWRNQILFKQLSNEEEISNEQLQEQQSIAETLLRNQRISTWDLTPYLQALSNARDLDSALAVLDQLQAALPERSFAWVRGVLLNESEQAEAAAEAIIEAFQHPEPLTEESQIFRMLAIALQEDTIDRVSEVVFTTPYHFGNEIQRKTALGIVLVDKELELERATELLHEAHAAQPDNPLVTNRLGILSEDIEQKEALARKTLMLAPNWTYARFLLADLLNDQGRHDEVLELTAGHTDEDLYLLRLHAEGLLHTGHSDQACKAYQELFERAERVSSRDFYFKWMAESRFGLFERAIETLQAALKIYPSWEYLRSMLAQTQSDHGDYEAAQATIEQARTDQLNDGLILLSEYHLVWTQQNYLAALEVCDRALAYTSNLSKDEESEESDESFEQTRQADIRAWEIKRIRQLLELGRFDEAYAQVQQQERDASFYGIVAWEANHAEEMRFALDMANAALEQEPESFQGLFVRASSLHELEGDEAGIAAYEILRQTHPDEHNAYEKLAQLLGYDNKLDEALELANRAVLLGPFCHVAWATRGYIHMARGEDNKALSDFQHAWSRSEIEHRVNGMNTYWWVWKTLEGDQEAAESYYQRAVGEINSDNDRRHIAHAEAMLATRAAA